MAIKDQYDTFELRTTSGADAQYANDRPPEDATFVKRLRDAGAIILAKANLAEYATVVLANSELIDKLGVAIPSSIPVRAPIVCALGSSFRFPPQPCGASA
jgi:Asp-tRNA(Asn)/Glu-tRNA(Gln) amidotransferase A subunit family amidase